MNQLSPILSAPPEKPKRTQPHHSTAVVSELHNCLEQTLDSSWELFLRPFLNGDYPPLAALHPIHGLTIFGVFPWNLRTYRHEQRGRHLRYFVRTESGQQPILNPVRQVEHYVENLINLYLPYIGETISRDRRSLSVFQIGLYFPEVNSHAAQLFAPIAPGRGTVFGSDAIEEQDLARILPASQRPGNRSLPQDWLDGLRFWLAPPVHKSTKSTNYPLTEEQRRHVDPAPLRHQRLHGVAGSGKTVVIAQRAANLAAQGKRVLVVTFNTTLWQYIRHLVDQSPVEFSWENIEFHHFHGFCKNVLTENCVEWPRATGRTPQQALDEIIPQLIHKTAETTTNPRKYDAILIDEGQDFLRAYYDTLCLFLSDNDEVLFVADRRQNLYLRDEDWLAHMHGTKFRGRWREMKQSYRLPATIATEINRFAAKFLTEPAATEQQNGGKDDNEPHPKPAGPMETAAPDTAVQMIWHNVEEFDTILDRIHQTIQQLLRDGAKPAEIVVLTPHQKDGWHVVTHLEQQGWAVNHILTADDSHPGRKQRRFRKRTFVSTDERLKVSTIHSFKGWELKYVILVTPADDHYWKAQSPYLFYVAMTRTQQSLIVFNRHPAYRAYGMTWNKYSHETTSVAAPGF